MSQSPIFRYNELFSNPVRLLVKESHAIFSSIPRSSGETNKVNAINISRRYRSIVHECVENLTRDITCDYSEQIKTFKELEVTWNLCEILFLDVHETGTLILQLKNWIKMHFNDLDEEALEILKLVDNGGYVFNGDDGRNDTYWDLFTKLVLRGENKKAIKLLSCHHEFQRNDQMQLVASMLESMPLSNQYIVHEFCNKWLNWSAWCKSQLGTGQFANNSHLLNIVRLLSQDITVYDHYAKVCKDWYPLMVAYLLYSDPCIRNTDLSDLCRKMISTFKKNNSKNYKSVDPSPFDEIIIATFEYDLVSVIVNCCSYLDDNWWFVTHFVDLLHASNQLRIHEIPDSDLLRESFLQDYASTLFDDELLWPIGVSYLDKCSASGMHHLEILLSHVPLSIDDETRAHKILSIAKKRGLNSLIKSTCLLMAQRWISKTIRLTNESIRLDKPKTQLQQNPQHQHINNSKQILPPAINLSNAMYWAVKSGDSAIITYMSDQYLYYFCKTGTFPDKSVFESLRRSPLENERLAFLTKYFEFKQILEESGDTDLIEAGNLLKALLASKIFPRFFCRELLEDAKNLLEIRPQLVFHPENTLDLMKSVEEITKESLGYPREQDDVELRKNLVRNMARALITPVGIERYMFNKNDLEKGE